MGKVGNYRYVVGGLICAIGAINYMDRQALSIASPVISKQLDLSHAQLGIIFSSFYAGFAIFAFLGGKLADRFGPWQVFFWAAGAWSLICGVISMVTGFWTMLAAQVIFSFAEGPLNATANRSVANWFPRNETGRVIGLIFGSHTAGSTIAGPLVGLLTVFFGWRVAFIIIAALGFCWIILWRVLATDHPSENRRVGHEEAAMIQASRASFVAKESADEQLPLRAFLLRADVLAVAAGLFAVNYTLFVFMSWLPMYFTEGLHMNMKSMSILSFIPWAAAASGALVGGAASDFLFKRMKNATAARKLAAVLPLFLVGASLVAFSFVTTAGVSVAIAALLLFCNSWAGQGVWSLEHEMVPAKHLGAIGGYIHCLSLISGVIGPAVTGYIAGRFGGYNAAFLLAAAVSVAGAILMSALLRTGSRSDRGLMTPSVAA